MCNLAALQFPLGSGRAGLLWPTSGLTQLASVGLPQSPRPGGRLVPFVGFGLRANSSFGAANNSNCAE